MSKIAEQKAFQIYPMVNPPYSNSNEPKLNVENLYRREGYINGYDQAMQDFLEKTEKILTERMYFSDDDVNDFKNYMKG